MSRRPTYRRSDPLGPFQGRLIPADGALDGLESDLMAFRPLDPSDAGRCLATIAWISWTPVSRPRSSIRSVAIAAADIGDVTPSYADIAMLRWHRLYGPDPQTGGLHVLRASTRSGRILILGAKKGTQPQ